MLQHVLVSTNCKNNNSNELANGYDDSNKVVAEQSCSLTMSNAGVNMNDDDDDDNDDSHATTTTTTNSTTATSCKQSYAFTIDNFNDKDSDPLATAAKYRNMLERFQNRHRRGASMSKIESGVTAATELGTTSKEQNSESKKSLSSSVSSTPLLREALPTIDSGESATNNKVKLRARDRSATRMRDAAKRHSWSPRSSGQTHENNTNNKHSSVQQQQQHHHHHHHHQQQQQQQHLTSVQTNHSAQANKLRKNSNSNNNNNNSNSRTGMVTAQLVAKGTVNMLANRTNHQQNSGTAYFTPRSTAMQLALQKVDFVCLQPPLADFEHLKLEADDISETGTYTLDGDNYTEEQKDLMNIDKSARNRQAQRPKELVLNSPCDALLHSKIPVHQRNSQNVLEINYYHNAADDDDETPQAHCHDGNEFVMGKNQSACAYLQTIKSRVLRQLPDDNEQPVTAHDTEDVGCFTSVTTSGVLAKQCTLNPSPKASTQGFSTSQIDSSEYVSNETKLKQATAGSMYAAGRYTDLQKAEYRLNVFTNMKDNSAQQQKFAATRHLIESPPDTPKLSDTAILKTAQTKNDWIQQWARNARARSLANDCVTTNSTTSGNNDINAKNRHNQELMTRSYTCAEATLPHDSNLCQRAFFMSEKLGGDCDCASDTAVSMSSSNKPPKSPTKIPSPLHTMGRARSASRTRASLQNILNATTDSVATDSSGAEHFLQRTAAAISNLQQSLTQRNSLKSPVHATTRRGSDALLYSPDSVGLNSPTQQRSPFQRSNMVYTQLPQQQLMTSSFNEQQLALLTSGEYLVRKMRMRKNSLDNNLVAGSPVSPPTPAEQQKSPLSAKMTSHKRAARPQFQHIYTPPAARHNYGAALALATTPTTSNTTTNNNNNNHAMTSAAALALKKSVSSNNFRKMYSDYEDNLQYYVHDEDELAPDYYSSGNEDEEDHYDQQQYQQQQQQQQQQQMARKELEFYAGEENTITPVLPPPLTNTRLNKALLMRIENSKQRVAVDKNSIAQAGVIACPNTPELPRRGIKSATSTRPLGQTARQSMPRDTSLSRLATQVPNSLASAKKHLLQAAAAGMPPPSRAHSASTSGSAARVQAKYLDISKYKSAQGNQFLRKNEAKSTLKSQAADPMKRSPSSSGLSRTDPARASNRSVRSVPTCMTSSGTTLTGNANVICMTTSSNSCSGRANSAARRDAIGKYAFHV